MNDDKSTIRGLRGAGMSAENWIDLRCHQSTPNEVVRTIKVLVRRWTEGQLKFTFRLDGDISRLRIPAPLVPRFAERLWQHTCFEVFIAMAGQPSYHEFNFAPSGEWAVYTFSGYRNGGPLANEMLRPSIVVRSTDDRLELDGVVMLDCLSAIHPGASLDVGLSAVIEAHECHSYWALRHPLDKPDFHDADGFALRLEPPGHAR
jgi:hypothetical protein